MKIMKTVTIETTIACVKCDVCSKDSVSDNGIVDSSWVQVLDPDREEPINICGTCKEKYIYSILSPIIGE